jgi:hypothetical protein
MSSRARVRAPSPVSPGVWSVDEQLAGTVNSDISAPAVFEWPPTGVINQAEVRADVAIAI